MQAQKRRYLLITLADWNQGGNKKQLLDIYSDFAPNVKALLEKADPDTLRLWQLLDMDKLQTWTRGRLALLGDAAHPFLPCKSILRDSPTLRLLS